MVNGRILPIVWFQEGQSVNTEIYLKLLQNDMWPAVRHNSDRENYYFQQDGATPHCAKKCLDFLEEKFPGRVISRRAHRAILYSSMVGQKLNGQLTVLT